MSGRTCPLKNCIAISAILLLTAATNTTAKTIYVDNDNPADFNNIQAGIDAAEDGDTVLVAPGEYIVTEPINYGGKNIILKSEEGPENTTIRMENPINNPYSHVFIFENNETNEAVLEGFTITGGVNAGGIYCENSSPSIKRNIIAGNSGGSYGGIFCFRSIPQIIENIIQKNRSALDGGGINLTECEEAIVTNNIIRKNYADGGGGGIYCGGYSSIIIKENILIDNLAEEDGGGIFLTNSEAIIEKNIIARNRTSEDGGGISSWYSRVYIIGNTLVNNSTIFNGGGIDSFENLEINLINNIVYNNTPTDLSGIQPSQVFYSNISQEGFAGINGNICTDPLLVNPNPDPNTLDNLIENGDYEGAKDYLRKCYSLQQDSPCIDAGDPANDDADPDSTVADLGAIYFNQRTCRADLYYDGFINFLDYAKFANSWLKTYPGLEGDIYIDNKVDYKDLEILTENWLNSCED